MIDDQSREPAKPVIAIVDDDASFLRSVARLLRSTGYAVLTFGAVGDFLAAMPQAAPRC